MQRVVMQVRGSRSACVHAILPMHLLDPVLIGQLHKCPRIDLVVSPVMGKRVWAWLPCMQATSPRVETMSLLIHHTKLLDDLTANHITHDRAAIGS